jgi:hypothetical protein
VMIVWGGNSGADMNSGGRYNPTTDSWLSTSIGANAPAVRSFHTAVWTGSEMIVWGGGGSLNTGGKYNPATDTWLTTSVGANVPTGRYQATAVWTGGEMIVWGGTNGLYPFTGGRYNPMTNSWLATSIGANVPAGRRLHTAVWTSSAMIVWGGYYGLYMDTGGIYSTVPAPIGTSLRGSKSATVNLSWTVSSGATSYNVKRCVAACTPAAIIATPITNNYSEAIDNTSYFYAVEAVNACGATP